MTEPFLIGDAVTGGYGRGPDILHECTISVNPGEIAVIVGPNGAGKSTAMKAIFGMLNVRSGAVRLEQNISPLLAISMWFRLVKIGTAVLSRQNGVVICYSAEALST